MTDISDGADLMDTARDVLLRELLPALPAERRYPALMIANAMAIAAREQRLAPAATRDESARLAQLLAEAGQRPRAAADIVAPEALPALRKAACAAIRSGAFDPPERAAALATALAQTARDWVAISNPKALAPER